MFNKRQTAEPVVSASAQRDASVIEDGLTFTGNTVCTGNLHLEGEINGDIRCGSLSVGTKGRVIGTVVAEEIIVAGNLKGTISAMSVILKPGSHVDGDITYNSLEIAHGAHFEGKSKRSDNPIPAAANGGPPKKTAKAGTDAANGAQKQQSQSSSDTRAK